MRKTIRLMTTAVLIVLVSVPSASSQTPAEIWRGFAERVGVGSELSVRLDDGRRVRATLVGVRDDGILVQPKTRVPVPIQAIPYQQIVRMEKARSGVGAGKAVAIGIVTGVGAFFGVMAIVFAAVDD